jgi:hypothetical protein
LITLLVVSIPNESISNFQSKPAHDFSLWFLFFSNITTIYIAVKKDWDILPLLWTYLLQFLVIGIVSFIRIVLAKKMPYEFNGKVYWEKPDENNIIKFIKGIFWGFLFLLHYGLLFIALIIVLIQGPYADEKYWGKINTVDIKYIVFVSLIFFVNHLFSYIYNRKKESYPMDINFLNIYPYVRIMPIFLVIGFGVMVKGSIFFFLILKTLIDLLTHKMEHEYLKKECEIALF